VRRLKESLERGERTMQRVKERERERVRVSVLVGGGLKFRYLTFPFLHHPLLSLQ
jgi:uridylate kinase